MEQSNNNNQNTKPQKCVYLGHKYFFCEGKYCIDPKAIGLPVCLAYMTYLFVHLLYYDSKYIIDNNTKYIIIILISIGIYTLEIFQVLNTSLTNSGFFLPNYWGEDNSNKSDAKLMIATIEGQDYFLKFCRTCKMAKDLRVYHCPDCDLCILRHDHHCPWLSTCIGFNNHKKFLLLALFSFFYFGNNSADVYILIKTTTILDSFSDIKFDKVWILILAVLNGFSFLFCLVLILTHIRYISTGQTTSENVRRMDKAKNPFSLGSCIENQKEFWNYPLKYKERITYNKNASKYVDTNILIQDYFSGNYYIAKDNKIISGTYDINGYNYEKSSIELPDQPYENQTDESSNSTSDSQSANASLVPQEPSPEQ